IDFADAQCIFKDKFFRISYDAKHSYGEKRWKVIGNVGKILVIHITYRDKKIRLISARKATAKERRIYYGDC
ncbi:toxin BrnT, partial [Candidatus Termititenax persephonae]